MSDDSRIHSPTLSSLWHCGELSASPVFYFGSTQTALLKVFGSLRSAQRNSTGYIMLLRPWSRRMAKRKSTTRLIALNRLMLLSTALYSLLNRPEQCLMTSTTVHQPFARFTNHLRTVWSSIQRSLNQSKIHHQDSRFISFCQVETSASLFALLVQSGGRPVNQSHLQYLALLSGKVTRSLSPRLMIGQRTKRNQVDRATHSPCLCRRVKASLRVCGTNWSKSVRVSGQPWSGSKVASTFARRSHCRMEVLRE